MRKKPSMGDRPFPWTCVSCGRNAVVEEKFTHSMTAHHDGKAFELVIDHFTAPRCHECSEIVLDRQANAQIADAIRRHQGLLRPDEIRHKLQQLVMTQKQLADKVNVSPETLSRWMSGAVIQSRNNDRRLREFLQCPLPASIQEDFAACWREHVEATRAVQELVFNAHSTWCFDLAEVA
jgi:DNA-binding transcriptional regulator YiaG